MHYGTCKGKDKLVKSKDKRSDMSVTYTQEIVEQYKFRSKTGYGDGFAGPDEMCFVYLFTYFLGVDHTWYYLRSTLGSVLRDHLRWGSGNHM